MADRVSDVGKGAIAGGYPALRHGAASKAGAKSGFSLMFSGVAAVCGRVKRFAVLLVSGLVVALAVLAVTQEAHAQAPTLSSISPEAGASSGGQTVTIQGANLTGASIVRFAGVSAASFTVDSPTQITAVTAPRLGLDLSSGPVSVTTPGGTVSRLQYTYLPQARITTYSDGEVVTTPPEPDIRGNAAVGATVELFVNGVSRGSDTADAMGVWSVRASLTQGTYDLATRATHSGSVGALSAPIRIYVGARPDLTSVSPSAGSTAGGQTVVLTGVRLDHVNRVRFGANDALAFTIDSASHITATVPPGAAGLVDIILDSSLFSVPIADAYTYLDGVLPGVDSLSPAAGPVAGGTTVTITGVNFTDATAVAFDGDAAASFTVDSDTRITAVSPPRAAGPARVQVTTPAGASLLNLGSQFSYVQRPTLSNVSPSSGSTAGGTAVTLRGSNMDTATGVVFGDVPAASFQVIGDEVRAVSPPHAAEQVFVQVITPGGISSTSGPGVRRFTFVASQPSITALSPASAGAGATVTITGTGFTAATAVTFGGVAATSFTVDSDTQVTAVVPAGSGTAEVQVTTAGGASDTAGAADDFTYVNMPQISIADVSANEGDSGYTTVPIIITLSEPAPEGGVSFGLRTSDGTATVADMDYVGAEAAGMTIPAGQSSIQLTVTFVGDTKSEPDEHFFVDLYAVSGAVIADGQAQITILNDDAPLPVITSLSRSAGPMSGGASVVITGTNLGGATAVHFGAAPAWGFTVNSDTQITATSPSGSGLVDIRVTTDTGASDTSGSADDFFFAPEPVVISMSPATGPTAGGTTVVLTGTGFDRATDVRFGGLSSSFTVDSDTQITAVSPARMAGVTDVLVVTPGGSNNWSGAGDDFTYADIVFTQQPQDVYVGLGQEATFTAAADNAASYVWQQSSDSGATWADVHSTTDPSVSFNANAFQDGWQFRIVAKAPGYPDAVSEPATLHIVAAPTAPVIVSPAHTSTLNTATPTMSGTADANATVNIALTGPTAVTDTVTADGAGAWTYTPPTLSDGAYTLAVSATHAGETSAETSVSFTLDTIAPAAPTISQPLLQDGVYVANTTYAWGRGNTEPGARVDIRIDGTIFASPIAAANGEWNTDFIALAEGQYDMTLTATDEAGNVSPVTGPVTLVIDRTAPATPIVTNVTDGATVAPIGPLRLVTFQGTVEPGGQLTAQMSGRPGAYIGYVRADGSFEVSLTNVPDGEQTFRIRVGDRAFNLSDDLTITLTIDGTPPEAPTIASPLDDATLEDARPTITGATEANATVTVLVDGSTIGTTTADGSGAWSFTPSADLADGVREITATAADEVGNVSPVSAAVTVTISTILPELSISDVTVTEGDSGFTDAALTVSLSAPARSGGVSFTLATADGTATVADNDYMAATSGTVLTIVEGETSDTFFVRVVGDTRFEPDEIFYVNVGDVVGATVVKDQAVVTILNDDAQPAPTVTGLSIDRAYLSQQPSVTITGAGFSGATEVRFGAMLASDLVMIDDTTLTVTAPHAAGGANGGVVNVTVTGPGGTSIDAGAADDFTFIGRPVVTSLSPAEGPNTGGQEVTVTGENMGGVTVVWIYAGYVHSVVDLIIDSDAQLRFTMPDLAGPHPNGVTLTIVPENPSGEAAPQPGPVDDYVVVAVPNVTGIDVNSGTTAGGARVTLTGANLGTITGVTIGGAPASDLAVTTTSVAFTTPAGTGQAAIVLQWAHGDRPTGLTFNYAPDAPVITGAPPALSSSRTAGFTVTGDDLQVSLNGAAFTAVTAQPIEFTGLADGEHRVDFRSLTGGVAGNIVTHRWTVDATAPDAPSLGAPAPGSTITASPTQLTGTAEAGAAVTVYLNNFHQGTTTADGSGAWTFPLADPLGEGDYSVRLYAEDAAMNVSPEGGPFLFTVNLTAPGAPTIATPADGAAVSSTRPIFEGLAGANNTVEVLIDGVSAGTTTANGAGRWSLTPATDLGEGAHTVVATATDGFGRPSDASATTSFTVDLTPPGVISAGPNDVSAESPWVYFFFDFGENVFNATADDFRLVATGTVTGVIERVVPGASPFTVVVSGLDGAGELRAELIANSAITDAAGSGGGVNGYVAPFLSEPHVVQRAAPAAPVILTPVDGAAVSRVSFSGTAEPGSQVTVSIDGTPAVVANVDASGDWSVAGPSLADGAHTATAVASNVTTGRVSELSQAVSFTVDATAPAAPVITAPADGSILGDSQPTITGTAEENATVTIVIDGTDAGTVTASASGSWSFTPLVALADGPHTVSATATDLVGNTSAGSATVSFVVTSLGLEDGVLPPGRAGTSYAARIMATGGVGAYAYTLADGALPTGVSLSATGELAGTPTASGDFTFTIQVEDGSGQKATAAYALTVAASVIEIAPTSLPPAAFGEAYEQTLSASGGVAPYADWRITEGTLPEGLTLSGQGVIAGAPEAFGSFAFTVAVRDSSTGDGPYEATRAFALTVAAPPPPEVTETPPLDIPPEAGPGGSVSINLGEQVQGVVDGFRIVTQPRNGQANIGNDEITTSSVSSSATRYILVYSPDAGFMGADQVSVVAFGPGGDSTPATFTFHVAGQAPNLQAEVISDASITLEPTQTITGGPFTALRIVTPPAYGEARVEGMTIVFTPGAANGGETFLEYVVEHPFGVSAPGRIDLRSHLAVESQALTAQSLAGLPVTVRITDGVRGGPFTDAAVVSVSPTEAGEAVVRAAGAGQYDLTYTPRGVFDGEVVITYTLANAHSTATSTLTVTVEPRPDPSLDPDVRGLATSQVTSARRFADTQINNFQRRLEALRNGENPSSNGMTLNVGFGRNDAERDPRTALARELRAPELDPGARQDPNREFLGLDLWAGRQGAETNAGRASDGPEGRSRNAVPGDRAEGTSSIGMWTAGSIDWGRQDASGTRDHRFRTQGLTVGVDAALTDRLIVGGGVGYGRDHTEIGSEGSVSRARSITAALYGSWRITDVVFVDGVVGQGELTFDSRRWTTGLVGEPDAFAIGERDGQVRFVSATLGRIADQGPLRRSVYVRIDARDITLDAFTETGAGLASLSWEAVNQDSLSATLGVSWGWRMDLRQRGQLAPYVRLEWSRELQDIGVQGVRYADWASSPTYLVAMDAWSRDSLNLSLGAEWSLTRRLALGAGYRGHFGSASSSHGGELSLKWAW